MERYISRTIKERDCPLIQVLCLSRSAKSQKLASSFLADSDTSQSIISGSEALRLRQRRTTNAILDLTYAPPLLDEEDIDSTGITAWVSPGSPCWLMSTETGRGTALKVYFVHSRCSTAC